MVTASRKNEQLSKSDFIVQALKFNKCYTNRKIKMSLILSWVKQTNKFFAIKWSLFSKILYLSSYNLPEG